MNGAGLLRRAFKFRIYPSRSQISYFENCFSMCRHFYNWALEERETAYKSNQTKLKYKDQQNGILLRVKEEKPWFTSVHSQALQNVLRRLDNAYLAFFRRCKKGEAPGFPKYKKYGQWSSLTFAQYNTTKPIEDSFYVPKLGMVKIRKHREFPEGTKIKTLEITKDGDKWFACFSCEIDRSTPEPKQDFSSSVGIDLGVHDLAYPSEGEPIKAPRFLKASMNNLKKLQRKFSATEKGSKKRKKLLKAISKTHYRIRCLRKDFIHKVVNQILQQHDLIVIEDLNIRNMVRRPKAIVDGKGGFMQNGATAKAGLNNSILDSCWGMLKETLSYKAEALGKTLLLVNPAWTSQKCSSCGEIVKKSLSTRTHKCHTCGYSDHRDKNAALNILALGIQSLGNQTLEARTITL